MQDIYASANFVLILCIVLIVFASRIFGVNRGKLWILLFSGLLLHLAFAFLSYRGVPIPFTMDDPKTFEEEAHFIAQQWLVNGFMKPFYWYGSRLYPSLSAIIYFMIGRATLLLHLINVALSVLSLFVVYTLTLKMFRSRSIASMSLMLSAVYPILLITGSTTGREPLAHFGYILFCYLSFLFFEKRSFTHLSLVLLCAIGLALNHGAYIPLLLVLLLYLYLFTMVNVRFARLIEHGLIRRWVVKFLTLALITSIIIPPLYMSGFILGDVGGDMYRTFSTLAVEMRSGRTEGGSIYLSSVKINSLSDLFLYMPLLFGYFNFSPFVWNIYRPIDALGVLDGSFYIFLWFMIIFYWRTIYTQAKNKEAVMFIFLTILFISAVFSMVNINYGTAIRHRAKFFMELAVLASPAISFNMHRLRQSLYRAIKI